jgi:hypothetical protein
MSNYDPRYQQEADAPTLPASTPYPAQQENVRAGEPYVQNPPAGHVNPVPSQEDRNVRRANERYWATAIISFVLCVLEIILALRFVFRLLAANQGSAFVAALYSFSYIFAAPFSDIFTDPALGRGSVFEISTLVAMLIYALVAWGLIALARIVFAPTLTSRP